MRNLLLLTVCLVLLTGAPAAGWRIPVYEVRMEIQPDSSVLVTETITADFTGDPHHGIYREIPLAAEDAWGNKYRLRLDIVGVTDQKGAGLQTLTSIRSGRIHVRIGNPNAYVEDCRTYVIRYRVLRAVHFFREHDELYWNAVGREWEVPIESAACIVTLPSDVPAEQLRTAAYTGFYGSTMCEARSDRPDSRTARFWMTRPLSSGEGMTIVVGWPKGTVSQPKFAQEALWFVTDNGYFFLPPLFLLLLYGLWIRVGRDPDIGRSEMVTFDPPDNLHPAELGTLIDERVDIRDVAASIVDLAVRGFVHIKAETERGFLGAKTDYLLELKQPYEETVSDEKLTGFERKIVRGIFAGNQFRWMSSLSNSFYTNLPELRDELYDSMVRRGYFTHRPDSTRLSYRIWGIIIIVLGVLAAVVPGSAGVPQPLAVPKGWSLAFALCGVFLAMAARTMPRKTRQGRDALLKARGFEEYLSRAERQEIEFQERHDFFERFLPYAMAFGIADKWARAFEGIQTRPPEWWSGDGGTFRSTLFAHDLDAASRSWGNTMTSQPRSSGGGGGSGFSGGSSGGGGGGGGGGAW